MFGSFFVYYALVPFFPSASFYTAPNYAIYLLGLCLTFFEASALKETASSIILIVAATGGSLVSSGLEPYFSLYVTHHFAFLINGILNVLGIKTIIRSAGNSSVISFITIQGRTITVIFNWYCVGVSSLLIFSIILVILLIEEHSNLKSRMIWSMIGISGILVLNVLRVVIILLTDYFYGAEVGGTIHYVIGYTIFITWLTIFLYLFSKKTIQTST
jgi:exosortase/archaeosortase family protein